MLSSLLPLAPSAHAGHYAVTYTGGTNTSTDPPTSPPNNDSSVQGGWGGGDGAVYGGPSSFSNTASCAGKITATLTWTHDSGQTDQNDPAPTVELVQEGCDTGWSSSQSSPQSGYTVSGTFGNPLGGQSGSSALSSDQPLSRYSVQGGQTITTSVTATPSVTGSGSGSSIYSVVAYVNYGASAVSPITIDPIGATSDGKGGWDVLVGMKVSPFLSGIPTSCTVSNYQWTVTGTTMQSWTVSSDSTHTTEADGSGLLNIADPGWFWNDPKQTTETITCTATVKPPAGQGNPFTVKATQTVGVYLPTWSATGSGGTMNIRIVDTRDLPGGNDTDYWLTADPLTGSTQASGMNWQASCEPPSPCPVTFEKGTINIVQLVTPNQNYIDEANKEWQDLNQGMMGLDTSWPYGWQVSEDDPYQPYYTNGDSPGFDLTSQQATYASDMTSFEDYIMFQPYGTTEYVPLGNFKWSVNAGDTIPSTNNWTNFKNPAGIVEPSGSPVNFTQSNAYPSWTKNSASPTGWKPF